ncbi:MAG: FAD:protein FMN transferase [Bacteroidales bacterium]
MRIYLIALLSLLFVTTCNKRVEEDKTAYMEINGTTQGTTYMIKYSTEDTTNYRNDIEKIFKRIDSSLSTYNEQSTISRVNKNEQREVADTHFLNVFNASLEISEKTNGAFDITVAPLVNAWGFGFEEIPDVDSTKIDSILQFVGYNKVQVRDGEILKDDERTMLDMNAIAKGYTVDVVAGFLDRKGVENYLVEIGGEIRVKGKNQKNQQWKVGVDKPIDGNETPGKDLQAIIKLDNRSLATSGNYRQFYVKDGVKYSHTINPLSGYPVEHNLLSATVLADQCIDADAYATAFMVLGPEKSKEIVENNQELEAFFILGDKDGKYETYYSENIKNLITNIE